MGSIDITKQCKVKLELNTNGEALVYIYDSKLPSKKERGEPIGLFDKHGFHSMIGTEDKYEIEDGYIANDGIIWFRVYKRETDEATKS